jgi:hypothetical protein
MTSMFPKQDEDSISVTCYGRATELPDRKGIIFIELSAWILYFSLTLGKEHLPAVQPRALPSNNLLHGISMFRARTIW